MYHNQHNLMRPVISPGLTERSQLAVMSLSYKPRGQAHHSEQQRASLLREGQRSPSDQSPTPPQESCLKWQKYEINIWKKYFWCIYLFYSIYNIWAAGVNFHYWPHLKQFETISSPTSNLLSVMYISACTFSHTHISGEPGRQNLLTDNYKKSYSWAVSVCSIAELLTNSGSSSRSELTACNAGGPTHPATATDSPAGHPSVPPTGREPGRTFSSQPGWSPEDEETLWRQTSCLLMFPIV